MNQERGKSPIYREVQQFRQVWIWVVISALAALVWYAAVTQLILHRPFGGVPMPVIPLVVFWFIFGIGLPALFYLAR
ncbi:MAG: hypothetical protein GQ526_04470, partial [Ardenticatenales bacterium]|nr:hypothetical protein [Ardenticatenales bacterium]